MKKLSTLAVAQGRAIAKLVASDVRHKIIADIEQQADKWTSENKLIHAGAARQLAEELKCKFINKENK